MAKRRLKSQFVTVSCERHKELMVEGLWKAYRAQNFVDLNFVQWGGKSLVAHQVVADIFLSSQKLLSGVLTDLRDDPDQLIATMELLLEFLYTGKVQVDPEKLDGLLDLAQRLNFAVLVDAVLACGGSSIKRIGTPCENICWMASKQSIKNKRKKLEQTTVELVNAAKDCVEEGSGALKEPTSKRPTRIRRAVHRIGEDNSPPKSDVPNSKKLTITKSKPATVKVGRPRRSLVDRAELEPESTVRKSSRTKITKMVAQKRSRAEPVVASNKRKQWAVPICQQDENETALEVKDCPEPTLTVSNRPKEKVFKCGHCDFSSLDKEQAIQHIRTVHVKPVEATKSACGTDESDKGYNSQ